MHSLRSKFVPDVSDRDEDEEDTMTSASTIGQDSEDDYFGFDSLSSVDATTPATNLRHRSVLRESALNDRRAMSSGSNKTALTTSLTHVPSASRPLSHTHVTAGDLHTSTSTTVENNADMYQSHSRISSSNSGLTPTSAAASAQQPTRPLSSLSSLPSVTVGGGDINLRDEVMASIAKSIGLIQPPLSGTPSVDASPVIVARGGGSQSGVSSGRQPLFPNSFSSLSFLETADDSASTMTGASSLLNHPYVTGLDNEVEILCFAAGTSLVRAGERNAGKNHVLEIFFLLADAWCRFVLRH